MNEAGGPFNREEVGTWSRRLTADGERSQMTSARNLAPVEGYVRCLD